MAALPLKIDPLVYLMHYGAKAWGFSSLCAVIGGHASLYFNEALLPTISCLNQLAGLLTSALGCLHSLRTFVELVLPWVLQLFAFLPLD